MLMMPRFPSFIQRPISDALGLHIAVMLMGFTALFVEWVKMPIPTLTFWRCLLGAGTLGLWHARHYTRKNAPRQPSPSAWHLFQWSLAWRLLLGGALLASHWGLFFYSVQQAGVAVGVVTYALNPLFTALLEALVLGGRFSTGMLFCAGLSVMGVGLLVGQNLLALASALPTQSALLDGLGWGVLSGLAFSLLMMQNRWLLQHLPASLLASSQQLLAAFFLIPWLWQASILFPTELFQWLYLLGLGVFCTGLAHLLFIRALRSISARQATVVSSLEVVYAMLLAWWLLQQVPLVSHWLGAACVLAAVVWIERIKKI